MKNLKELFQFDKFGDIYNYKDEYGRGRFCMLLTLLLTTTATNLHGGTFYTKFLLMNGIDQSSIGVLSFLPYFACLFSLFSPIILEHFPRRRWILFIVSLVTNFINIMGITILPTIVTDVEERMLWFVILVVSSNILTQLFYSGTAAWNASFLPEHKCADYFASSAILNNMIGWGIALVASVVGDLISGTEHELPFLFLIRCIGYAMSVVASFLILVPKEFPYVQKERVKISNVFYIPIKNKKFLGTMLVAAAFHFVYNLPNATINVYLLEDVGISYTVINGVNAVFFVFHLLFAGMWTKVIKKYSWFKTLAIGLTLEAFTYFAYAFVTEDAVWLYILVRLGQHFTGVGVTLIAAAFVYINLPTEDKTYYITFHGLIQNASIFLAMLVGTVFTDWMGDRVLRILHYPFSATQILILACGVGKILVSIVSARKSKQLSP